MNQYYIAFDVGAGSMKAAAAVYKKDKIILSRQISFQNDPVTILENQYINIFKIMEDIKKSIREFSKSGICESMAIDTYGNGYGILDRHGHLIGMPRHYRDLRTDHILEKAETVISREELFFSTGIYPVETRVLFQLYCEVIHKSLAIEHGVTFLPLVNLLDYFLSGEQSIEKTSASVAYLLNREGSQFHYELFDKLGIPNHLFRNLSEGGRCMKKVSFGEKQPVQLISSIGHDTESALIAAPRYCQEKVFLSMGTSFIFGTQTKQPMINHTTYAYSYKNMVGAFGNYSLCKDFPGFWLLEQCLRIWRQKEPGLSYEDICSIVESAKENHSYIDVSDPVFRLHSDNVPKEIQNYCIQTGQQKPEGVSEIAKCIFESYALQLKWCLSGLTEIMEKKHYKELVCVGGGVRNQTLMQMIADALEVPVTAGSPFASSMGNILMQLYAKGEVSTLEDMREIAFDSSDIRQYEPQKTGKWRDALSYMKEKKLFDCHI